MTVWMFSRQKEATFSRQLRKPCGDQRERQEEIAIIPACEDAKPKYRQ